MSTLTTTPAVAPALSARVFTPAAPAALARALISTEATLAPAIARVTLGAVILPHGLQKTLGVLGGYGFSGTMGFLTGAVGLPWLVAFTVIAIESVGALALLLGLGSRAAAAGVAVVMIGATLTSHAQHGFFMNWSGGQAGEGFEYHLLALGLAAVVMIAGGGAASLDRWLTRRA
ncbi:MAG: DoxX family protein [Myxococcales bacterium]|nr:DoxX family protein [Myxococcales bacterium]